MKYFFIGIAVLVLLIGAGFVLNIIFYPVHTAGNLVKTAYDANDKVLNADNAIYNYEWFKSRKADIDAAKAQLDNARASQASFMAQMPTDRSKWGFEDKTEDSRLRTVVLGLENHLQDLIAGYNGRASMATRNIFQDGVLPSFIDALTFIKK